MGITLDFDYLTSAQRTMKIEMDSLAAATQHLDNNFKHACEIAQSTKNNGGRVIVTGMGKSGHIGNKIAATLASTGTPSFYLHPGEASHGDLGMVTKNDCILALSNSGTSAEIIALIPLFKRMNIKMISMTGNPNSLLAKASDSHLNAHVKQEACPLDLAPTSSTTVCLALGDALAIALLEASGFSAEDFAFSHPGGALGRKLLLKVEDLMRSGKQIPRVDPSQPLSDVLFEISSKGLGMTTVVNEQDGLLGVFTDGDLRRLLSNNEDIRTLTIADIMHLNCRTISPNALAAEALNIMEKNKITSLVVIEQEPSDETTKNIDTQHKVCGIIHLHAILEAGIA